MRPSLKLLVLSLPFLLIFSGTALADTCNSFATYSCAKSVGQHVHRFHSQWRWRGGRNYPCRLC